MTRGKSISAAVALRARTVLLAAGGSSNLQITEITGFSDPTVRRWRRRDEELGIKGLEDVQRPGKPRGIDELSLVADTLANDGKPPLELGISHWSARIMAERHVISFSSVARIWRRWKIQPHRIETFKFSTDPALESKLRDVGGLSMSPPANAVVVSIDEKTHIQALSRTAADQPLAPKNLQQQTHDYKRNGTTTLFEALDVLTGKLSANAFYQKHTNVEFVDFLNQVAQAHPFVDVHVICDNYATHKHQNVKEWLAANPRVTMHFTPTSCSWLNMVEIFFGVITRQCLKRGTFSSVRDFQEALERYIEHYNKDAKPFVWTTSADHLLGKMKRKQIINTEH
ncbi:IS630 family transposase [Paeniglutamicibacter cryotolerans]|uniref:Transposase n=1 Tax=Paeniglutamicibacter cryotolerans TaxID=670079 RepID=A0A839QUI4_9MICC|nr:IS630 family transposase [Paeniglutamicibacter cryotolerans]MBB2997626.1 transposase [Paeniglutamicibacter cryotolerans]